MSTVPQLRITLAGSEHVVAARRGGPDVPTTRHIPAVKLLHSRGA